MMRSRTTNLLLASMLVATGGCTSPLHITLFNNSGAPVAVQSGSGNIPVDVGRSAEFPYPGSSEQTFRLRRGACEYVYRVPRDLDHLPIAARPTYEVPGGLKAQIEGDFEVILLPVTANAVVPLDKIADLQQAGFPLRPSSVQCR